MSLREDLGTDSIQGYKILIIDDDKATNEMLKEYFSLYAYNVFTAADGAQGLQMIEIYQPDLILLDVDLRVMDGFRTMQTIRENPQQSKIPVIFISSLNRDNLEIKGLEMGADDYVEKPLKKSVLLARVRAALRRSERFKRSESQLKGNLMDVSLPELLQTMELSRKTAHVSLLDMDADMYMDAGVMVYIRIGAFVGVQAFQRIMLMEYGSFTMYFEPVPESMVDQRWGVQSLLMDTMRIIDELRRSLSTVTGEKNPLIAIDRNDVPKVGPFHKISPIPFNDLLVRMEGDLEENMALIMEAHNKGVLRFVSTASEKE